MGARQGLLDLVAVHEHVRPEQHGSAERHLLVPVEDLEAFAGARRLQGVCNRNGEPNSSGLELAETRPRRLRSIERLALNAKPGANLAERTNPMKIRDFDDLDFA